MDNSPRCRIVSSEATASQTMNYSRRRRRWARKSGNDKAKRWRSWWSKWRARMTGRTFPTRRSSSELHKEGRSPRKDCTSIYEPRRHPIYFGLRLQHRWHSFFDQSLAIAFSLIFVTNDNQNVNNSRILIRRKEQVTFLPCITISLQHHPWHDWVACQQTSTLHLFTPYQAHGAWQMVLFPRLVHSLRRMMCDDFE